MYEVELSNNMKLQCTPNHKWFININNQKEIVFTNKLQINDIIHSYELPIIDPKDPDEFINPYYHGFTAINNMQNNIFVPINYSIKTKLQWLYGLFDSITYIDTNNNQFPIYSTDIIFLKNIQLMLNTLSINPEIKKNNDTYILYISYEDRLKLHDLNFYHKYLSNNINKNSEYNLKIININKLTGIHKTYCFTEKTNNAGIFNGILTGQSETYSLQIDNIIRDKDDKNKLFNAVKELPCISDKIAWSVTWIESNTSFQTRLLAFAIVEGIFFSGSFCAIFWLKKRNIMPGLCTSNELISRDEGMHTQFAVLLYSMIKNKLPEIQVHKMFIDAVEIESKFICESLPCSLLGMNADLMKQYIKFVADRLLLDLNYSKIFNVINPFDFMESISIEGKTNFFESRPTQYQKSSILNKSREFSFDLINDF